MLYTDGLVEAADPESNEYGLERLTGGLPEATAARPCARWPAAVARDLEEFARGVPFADDRTLVLARRLEA